ncbi:anti-repressor SinI family protein [Lentibacillus amyloliquefaciens]|nr:anti-repressor SinI family protein [Lentibacillus amyloliquefaciens]
MKLDREWIVLVKAAKLNGLTAEEVRGILNNGQK